MKMKYLCFILLCFLPLYGQSQTETDSTDDFIHRVTLGYSLKRLRKRTGLTKELGPIYLKYEHALNHKNFSVGVVSIIYNDYDHDESINDTLPNGENVAYNASYFGFLIIPKIYYHFDLSRATNPKIRKFDFYFGAGIGYGYEKYHLEYLMNYTPAPNEPYFYNDSKRKTHYVAYDFGIGFNYPIKKNFGFYMEYGFNIARTQIGINYKW